jgi:hypothetical protein
MYTHSPAELESTLDVLGRVWEAFQLAWIQFLGAASEIQNMSAGAHAWIDAAKDVISSKGDLSEAPDIVFCRFLRT